MGYSKEDGIQTMRAFYQKHFKNVARKTLPMRNEGSFFTKKTYSSIENKAAKQIQKSFRQHIKKDKLLTIKKPENPNFDFYAGDFWDFIGNQVAKPSLKRSTNFPQIKKTAEALNDGDWQHPILKIEDHIFASMKDVINLLTIVDGKYLSRADLAKNVNIAIPLSYSLAKEGHDFKPAIKLAFIINAYLEGKMTNKQVTQCIIKFNLQDVLSEYKFKRIKEILDPNLFSFPQLLELELKDLLKNIIDGNHDVNIEWLETSYAQLASATIRFQTFFAKLTAEFEKLPHSMHLFYAISAYGAGFISREQVDTVLMRHELAQHTTKMQIITLIDDEGNITPEAEDYFLKIIPSHSRDDPTLEKFRMNLLGVPKSERTLFVFDPSFLYSNLSEKEKYEFHHLAGTYFDQEMGILAAAGAADALRVAIYGDRYVKSQARLGSFMLFDQSRAASLNTRYRGIHFPGAEDTFWVHDAFYSLFYAGYIHDTAHGISTSPLPNYIKEFFTHLENLIREATGIAWSKEMWEAVDRAFAEKFVDVNPSKIHWEEVEIIIDSLNKITLNSDMLTNVAFLVFALDYIEHFEWYKNNNLFREAFENRSSEFQTLFQNASDIQHETCRDHLGLRVLKLAFYTCFNSQQNMTQTEKKELFALIDEAYHEGIITFQKQKPTNLIWIKYLENSYDLHYITKEEFFNDIKEQLENKQSSKIERSH